MDNIVYLYDENDNAVPYEIVDRLNIATDKYVAIIRHYEDDEEACDDELLILEEKQYNNETYFNQIESDVTFDFVARIFRKRLAHLFEVEY